MKEKDLDKDTIVAYHAYLQHQIRSDLNNVGLGPSWLPCRVALICGILSFVSCIVGVLVICLRHRHVYLVDWWAQFVGPLFIIIFLLLAGAATYLLIIAKRRSNRYRRELFFRPLGDYGVAVVHKSTLVHDQGIKSELKSGTTPHKKILPRSEVYSSAAVSYHPHGRSRRPRDPRGEENRGYDRDDSNHRRGPPRDGRYPDDRRPPDDRRRERRVEGERRERRDNGEKRGNGERRERRDGRERSGEPEGHRPPPDSYRQPRGIPKIAVSESSDDSAGKIILSDPDFGRLPRSMVRDHDRSSESEL